MEGDGLVLRVEVDACAEWNRGVRVGVADVEVEHDGDVRERAYRLVDGVVLPVAVGVAFAVGWDADLLVAAGCSDDRADRRVFERRLERVRDGCGVVVGVDERGAVDGDAEALAEARGDAVDDEIRPVPGGRVAARSTTKSGPFREVGWTTTTWSSPTGGGVTGASAVASMSSRAGRERVVLPRAWESLAWVGRLPSGKISKFEIELRSS
nr:hypothetical protein [Halorubellus salinus]